MGYSQETSGERAWDPTTNKVFNVGKPLFDENVKGGWRRGQKVGKNGKISDMEGGDLMVWPYLEVEPEEAPRVGAGDHHDGVEKDDGGGGGGGGDDGYGGDDDYPDLICNSSGDEEEMDYLEDAYIIPWGWYESKGDDEDDDEDRPLD